MTMTPNKLQEQAQNAVCVQRKLTENLVSVLNALQKSLQNATQSRLNRIFVLLQLVAPN